MTSLENGDSKICPTCGAHFRDDESLVRHMDKEHPVGIRNEETATATGFP